MATKRSTGPALSIGTGIWTAASMAKPGPRETLHFPSLHAPVTVIFEANGTPHIRAANDDDLFWTIGYLHARFRLTQMDLLRRTGEGRLSEILGAGMLSTDQLQVMLGLDRTAQLDWQAIPAGSPVRQALQDYAQGANAWMHEAEQNNSLPFLFTLLNYRPQPWTPLDSLVILSVLKEVGTFSRVPLDYALLVQALGYQRTMQWFPVLPPDAQHPYDTGPYLQPASQRPLPSQLALGQDALQTIASLEQHLRALPPGVVRSAPESNNWAVNGPKAASGKAELAGDPHVDLTLPSAWYPVDASSPDYSFSGGSQPGLPAIISGHNQHISWSATSVQNQATLYYVERTDRAHPQQYYWNGAWRPMQHLTSTIPVKGQAPVREEVYLTVHGPIYPADQGIPGETISVDWMGALPSRDPEAFSNVLKATNFSQFRSALSLSASYLNFAYADDQGNIGMISPGYYPIVKSGTPWLPLPGTGESDVVGSIPYAAVPQVYDPPDHLVESANQRPVSNTYPYYLGTTWTQGDPGYRADEIYTELKSLQQLTMQDMERMQNSTHDYLADLIVPTLLLTLHTASLSGSEQQAEALLESWHGNMDASSRGLALVDLLDALSGGYLPAPCGTLCTSRSPLILSWRFSLSRPR